MQNIKFYIEIYGCQMNVYDAHRIRDLMISSGYEEVSVPHEAEVLIFYTCNIREKAAQKVLSAIGMMRSQKTRVIAIGGCVAQAEQEKLFRTKGVNIIFGPQTYHNLPSYVDEVLSGTKAHIIDVDFKQSEKFEKFAHIEKAGISEFVPIQEGCDNFCTYCIVPYTRGREYSRPAKDIISDIKTLASLGTQEVTLLGQNVNSYHGDAPYISIGQPKTTWRLERLICEILEIPGLKRLRYVSPHPKDFTEELMRLHAENSILVPFTHIPAQAGNDRILRLMNRGHTKDEYLAKIEKFRSICPNIQFSSDFIVGFPSETDTEFQDTLDLVRKTRFTLSYSFKYSRRRGTPADGMKDQVPEEVKEQRLTELQKTLLVDQVKFNDALVGQVQEVLFEKRGKKENQYIGKNVFLQSVIVESSADLIGSFKNVKITRSSENCVFGEII